MKKSEDPSAQAMLHDMTFMFAKQLARLALLAAVQEP